MDDLYNHPIMNGVQPQRLSASNRTGPCGWWFDATMTPQPRYLAGIALDEERLPSARPESDGLY